MALLESSLLLTSTPDTYLMVRYNVGASLLKRPHIIQESVAHLHLTFLVPHLDITVNLTININCSDMLNNTTKFTNAQFSQYLCSSFNLNFIHSQHSRSYLVNSIIKNVKTYTFLLPGRIKGVCWTSDKPLRAASKSQAGGDHHRRSSAYHLEGEGKNRTW